MKKDSNKKVVLITGASRGLGNAIASQLCSKGYVVYGGVRGSYKRSGSDLFIPVRLELTQKSQIRSAVNEVIRKDGRVDILIHCAGMLYAGSPDTFTKNEINQIFDVNVIGPILLTQLILPGMRRKNSGKIIFISSIRAVESHVFRGLYSGTKAAVESIAFDWAVALSRWNIDVCVVEPGPVLTSPKVIEGKYYSHKKNPYPKSNIPKFNWQSPNEAASEVVKIIEHKKPVFRNQTSQEARKTVSRYLKDPSGQKWLSLQKKWCYENS